MIQSFFRGVLCGRVDVADSAELEMPFSNKYRNIRLRPAHEYFREKCVQFGEKQALVDVRSDRSLSFLELLDTIENFAGALQSLGVQPRDRVALHGNNSVDVFVAFLAIQFVNATAVLCKTSLTVREMLYQCKTSDVKFIITDSYAYDVAVEVSNELPSVEMVILANMSEAPDGYGDFKTMTTILSERFEFEAPSDVHPREDGVLIAFTSGTTGLPKGVLHTHFSLQAQLECCGEDGSNLMRFDDTYLQWCPISHISGSIFLPAAIAQGAVSVLANAKLDVDNFVDICESYQITSVMAFPVVMKRLIELLRVNPGTCRSVKHVMTGGSVIAVPWSEALIQLLDLKSYRILYGMSETLIVTITDVNKLSVNSVGRSFPNTEMKILDISTRETLQPFEKGEVAIRSDFLMKEYDKNPEATAEIFTEDGFLLTGDFGYFDDQGQLYILERLKQMIKCMDNQLTPAELEDFLLQHDAVKEIVVIGLPDENLGEAPTAYTVLNDGYEATDELREELKNMISGEFAVYKHLYGGLHFVENLPKTDSGKFARAELKALVVAGKLDTW